MEEQTIGTAAGQAGTVNAPLDVEATTGVSESASAATVGTSLTPEELHSRLQQLEQEGAQYKDQYLRTAADLKNYKRRVEQDRSELVRNAGASILVRLLPILDDLDLAMQHVPQDVAGTAWFNGLQGVQRKLLLIMEGEGVKPIDAHGKPFDPTYHEAVMNEDAGPEHAGKVTAELRRGYTLHERVLRPAMVKVGQE
ncbi:MAG: nucleotide exchange factor GrpE [Herpetosiphon sp.]